MQDILQFTQCEPFSSQCLSVFGQFKARGFAFPVFFFTMGHRKTLQVRPCTDNLLTDDSLTHNF